MVEGLLWAEQFDLGMTGKYFGVKIFKFDAF